MLRTITHNDNQERATDPVAALFDWIHGPIRFALLDWAIRENIFDLCLQPRTSSDLSGELSCDANQLETLLRALTSMQVLSCSAEGYQTASAFMSFLTSGETSLVPTIQALSKLRHQRLDDLSELARAVPEARQKQTMFNAEHWQKSSRSLRAFHRAVAADVMFDCLSGLPQWANITTLLDIGAGSDALARRIIKDAPDKEITLFDINPVADILIEQCQDLQQVRVAAGDYNDGLPNARFDLIWASMSLYFIQTEMADFLSGLRKRLSPSGIFVSLHEGLENGRTRPEHHVIGRLIPSLHGKDSSFDKDQIKQAAQQAGFLCVKSEALETSFGPFQLEVFQNPA